MEIAAEAPATEPARGAVPPGGRGPLALLAGLHRLLGQHRDAAHPAVAIPVGGAMNTELSDEAKEYGRASASGVRGRRRRRSWCSAPRPIPPTREALVGPRPRRARRVGPRTARRRRRARGGGRAVPQRRLLGAALPGRRAAGPAGRPRRRRAARRRRQPPGGADRRRRRSLGRGHVGRPTRTGSTGSVGRRTGVRRAAGPDATRRRRRAPTSRWRWCCRAGRCSECSTGQWNSPSPTSSMRQQFGQPLSAFQSVQFQLTDAEVERAGLEMLAKYALWSVGTAPRRGRRRRARAADGRARGGRGRLPRHPPAARCRRLLRRDHAVVAVALQPAAAPPAARPVGHPRPADRRGSAAAA